MVKTDRSVAEDWYQELLVAKGSGDGNPEGAKGENGTLEPNTSGDHSATQAVRRRCTQGKKSHGEALIKDLKCPGDIPLSPKAGKS